MEIPTDNDFHFRKKALSDYDDIGAAYNADKIHTNLAVINSFAAKHPEVPTYFMAEIHCSLP